MNSMADLPDEDDAKLVGFYFDEMMPRAVAGQIIESGFQVIMAVDVDMRGKDDVEHLRYAAEHDLVLVTHDHPFAGRTMKHSDHAGLICWTGSAQDIGGMVRTLIEFAQTHRPDDARGRVFWRK